MHWYPQFFGYCDQSYSLVFETTVYYKQASTKDGRIKMQGYLHSELIEKEAIVNSGINSFIEFLILRLKNQSAKIIDN